MLTSTLLVACGGVTVERSDGSGGGSSNGGAGPTGGSGTASGGARPSAGGKGSSAGGAAALRDCVNLFGTGGACAQSSAHCGGPCSNSWQAEYVCADGSWSLVRTVPCGPGASNPPKCRNSFGGGELTPCCPADKLDCAGKPDGYPGFGCTPGQDSFCSCTCWQGTQTCGC